MKKISLVLVCLFVVLGFSGSALAVGMPLNTGTLLGTYDINNDKETDVERQLTGVDLSLFKTEDYDKMGVKSGSSTFTGLVYYYTVKVADSFALYQIAGGATSVDWANETIKNKHYQLQDVSHVTFWTTTKTVSAVPIPASVFLFGSGLLGVLGLVRSKKKQSH